MSKTTEDHAAHRASAYAVRVKGPHGNYSAPFQKRLAKAWLDGWMDRPLRGKGGSNFDTPLHDAWIAGRAEGARLARLWN